MKEYLATLSPLLRPRIVFGDYIKSSQKETVRGADKAFNELQALYESVASVKPFNLPKELNPPIEIISTTLDVTVMEYVHEAKTDRESKKVVVTSPLKWVLSYSGYSPSRLREILSARNRDAEELKQFLLHYLVLHIVISKQSGVGQILEALHFPLSIERIPEFGQLPITYISSDISTLRPSDAVIIENTEVSGMDAFEEVVNVKDIAGLRNPLKDKLVEVVKSHDEKLLG
jgi:hypothetical protein